MPIFFLQIQVKMPIFFLQIQVFDEVTLCRSINIDVSEKRGDIIFSPAVKQFKFRRELLDPEDEDSIILRNVGKYLLIDIGHFPKCTLLHQDRCENLKSRFFFLN